MKSTISIKTLFGFFLLIAISQDISSQAQMSSNAFGSKAPQVGAPFDPYFDFDAYQEKQEKEKYKRNSRSYQATNYTGTPSYTVKNSQTPAYSYSSESSRSSRTAAPIAKTASASNSSAQSYASTSSYGSSYGSGYGSGVSTTPARGNGPTPQRYDSNSYKAQNSGYSTYDPLEGQIYQNAPSKPSPSNTNGNAGGYNSYNNGYNNNNNSGYSSSGYSNTGTSNAGYTAPSVANSPASYIAVFQKGIPLEGRLKDKFEGIRITLRNKQANYIEVVQGEVTNGVDGQTAYQMTDNSRQRGILTSIATAPLGYIPYVGYGSGAISTAASYGGAVQDQNTANSTIQKVRAFPTGIISPNDEISINTLVPKNETPRVRVIFKDLKTNEMFTFIQ
ncbi:MAG: hypothetical protein K2X66_10705 [Cyanobacteria bacterium]|nr:hypothetical protein [Cyanobacteriota bacterium]